MKDEERIKELEEQLRTTRYNKKTQHAIGLRKAQLAALRKKVTEQKKAGAGKGYAVKRTGDATIVMVGFPSVGKSTLLNKLTNQESEVGSYDFTTLETIPGLLEYKGAKIQILDLPGLVGGAAAGKGRGKEVLSVIREADLCMLIADINKPEQLDRVREEIYGAGIRLNQKNPDVRVWKRGEGGITINRTLPLDIDDETVKGMLKELGFVNADILIRSKVNEDQLIDAVLGNRKYMNAVTVLTKSDTVSVRKSRKIKEKYDADIAMSAETGKRVEKLKEMIFDKLGLIRIYMKEPGKDADMEEPLIISGGSKIKDVCKKLHRDMLNKFRFARVWGPSAKHPGQRLMLDHEMKDKDILEIHLN